jgi:hypothetical protein
LWVESNIKINDVLRIKYRVEKFEIGYQKTYKTIVLIGKIVKMEEALYLARCFFEKIEQEEIHYVEKIEQVALKCFFEKI